MCKSTKGWKDSKSKSGQEKFLMCLIFNFVNDQPYHEKMRIAKRLDNAAKWAEQESRKNLPF